MNIPALTLGEHFAIPQVGLGLWKNKDDAEFATAFQAGIDAGYRHFDSAQAYDNEHLLGIAWKKSGLKREDLFITTKIAVQNFGHNRALRKFDESLQKLQTDYVDLLLLHFPVTLLRKIAWQAAEEIHAAGRARSVGVSNYMIHHLEEMKHYAKVMPAVNQIELHVFLQQPELVRYCKQNNILIEAYAPLAHARETSNQTVQKIAAKHGKSYAQIMLRWLIEQDFVVLPKSVHPERILENITVFDFSLDEDDKGALAKEDHNLRTCWSPVHIP